MSLSATSFAEAGPQYRILVVIEALPTARPFLSALADAGFECHYAPGGGYGLTAFDELKPHLVLMDTAVSDMSAAQVCQSMRARGHVPIILLTDADATRHSDAKLGANEFLPRTISPQSLTVRVEALLQCIYGGLEAVEVPLHIAASTPKGWGSCEACNYMGPRAKFECIRFGEPHLACPHCKRDDAIVLSIG